MVREIDDGPRAAATHRYARIMKQAYRGHKFQLLSNIQSMHLENKDESADEYPVCLKNVPCPGFVGANLPKAVWRSTRYEKTIRRYSN